MELPKLEYGTPSKFLLSLSIYFLTITLLLVAFYWYNESVLSISFNGLLAFYVLVFGVLFFITLNRGTKLLDAEDKARRIKYAIERDILLREYWIKCIEYNEKAKMYNKKYKTPSFPEKGALEFPEFLKEADSLFIEKLERDK